MISNKETMEKMDSIDADTSNFLRQHMSRINRVPLNSII
jgi:hypothetical protein